MSDGTAQSPDSIGVDPSIVGRLTSEKAPVFFYPTFLQANMKSVRKALRDGDLDKDTYDRLVCGECEKPLKTENDPDEIKTVRICPDCASEWKEIR